MWQPLHRRPSVALYTKKRAKRDQQDGMQIGGLLSDPRTNKINCENVDIVSRSDTSVLEVGHASMQGYRISMEDEHIIDLMDKPDDHILVAIMDGHAGKFVAKFVSIKLKEKIAATSQWKQYCRLYNSKKAEVKQHDHGKALDLISQALVQAYKDLDDELRILDANDEMDESGSTVVAAIITPTHVVCANVGDSRCVVGSWSSSGATKALTEDHKPSNPDEQRRIERAGGFVLGDRVNGELAMSRALGDFRYKRDPKLLHAPESQQVTCFPDIAVHERSGRRDELMVLACDGVWDVVSNAEATAFLTEIVLRHDSYKKKLVARNSLYVNITSGQTKNCSSRSMKPLKRARVQSNNNNEEEEEEEEEEETKNRGSGIDNAECVSAQEAAEALIELAFTDGSTDNISAIVVKYL